MPGCFFDPWEVVYEAPGKKNNYLTMALHGVFTAFQVHQYQALSGHTEWHSRTRDRDSHQVRKSELFLPRLPKASTFQSPRGTAEEDVWGSQSLHPEMPKKRCVMNHAFFDVDGECFSEA